MSDVTTSSLSFPQRLNLPLIEEALYELERNIKAPTPLIFSSLLASISLVSQGLIDVRTPAGHLTPTSLMILTIAKSGERKSSVESVVLKSVKEFQNEQEEIYKNKYQLWKSEHSIWEYKNKALLRQIGKMVTGRRSSDQEEQMLKEHQKLEPLRPKQPKWLYEDATPEALVSGLHNNLSSAGLFSSEGGSILNGRSLGDVSKLNSIWSGDSVPVDRKSTESFKVEGARLTVSIMAQESAFEKYMARCGEESRGVGLWARFLVCHPLSTQGTRFSEPGRVSWSHCDKFSCRLIEMLKSNNELLCDKPQERKVINFSEEAANLWFHNFNEIEKHIGLKGYYFEVSDHASKLSDNIARVAALLHNFQGEEGDISARTIEVSIKICKWYSEEFIRIFRPIPQDKSDVLELKEWFVLLLNRGQIHVPKNYVRQFGPNRLRFKERLDKALNTLINEGAIVEFIERKTRYLNLSPAISYKTDSSMHSLTPDRYSEPTFSRRYR